MIILYLNRFNRHNSAGIPSNRATPLREYHIRAFLRVSIIRNATISPKMNLWAKRYDVKNLHNKKGHMIHMQPILLFKLLCKLN
jgi:hypothetical protein